MRLVAVSGGQTLSFPLRQGSMIVGRHPSCHICIPYRTISRRHCQFHVDGSAVSIRDLGSSHGTFVNGQRTERADLCDGDTVSLGGFELRFEVAEGAAAYAQGARPAEDIVVSAQPAAGEKGPGAFSDTAPGPFPQQQPYAQEPPPPAPTDFPESPNGEETPVDQSFMPAPYVPHQETVLGPAMQPQLVVRDGHWFLRDPRTGREVEIAPKGGEGAVAARPAAELRRPNVRLLVAVVTAAVIAVIGFSYLFFQRTPPTNNVIRISDAEYVKDVDDGLEALQKGKFDDAIAKFDLATRKRKDIETARLLTRYASLLEAAKGDFLKLNKSEAKRYLESILNTRCPSDKAIAFAREQLDWLDRETVAVGLYEDAVRRLGGRDNEEVMLEVLQTLLQIPEDRYAAKLAKETIRGIKKDIAATRLGRAEREKAQSKWADAIPHYQDALPYIEDPALKARIPTEIAECRRYIAEADLIKQAREAIRSQSYSVAREALKGIKPGIYYETAQRLLTDIRNAEERAAQDAIRQQVLDLYKRGDGPGAAALAEKHKLPQFSYISERVKRIEDLLAAGKKADEAKRYEEAQEAYEQAVAVESDTDNDYHRRAQAALDALKARAGAIAVELAEGGYRVIDSDPVKARQGFERALKFDPENERAKRGLGNLESNARLLYNDGRRHVMEGRPAHAKAILERARDCAPPGSDLHKLIMQELEKLRE